MSPVMTRRNLGARSAAKKVVALVFVLLVAMGLVLPVSAASGSQVVTSTGTDGLTANPALGALSARWWQYVLGQPTATNPLTDPTGARCRTGQSGPVFFLVGTAGAGTATRNDCVVPYGKAIFFPIANAFDVHVAPDGLDTPQLIWDDLQVTYGFEVTSVFASVDGVSLPGLTPQNPLYRGCVGQDRGCFLRSFTLTLPADNLVGLPAGKYKPTVADGSYALIPPLKKGMHTIIFRGAGNLGGPFTSDITYRITVA